MLQKKVEIIVPAHNEEDNIFPLYKEVLNVFENSSYTFKLIFIDDGSTDKTLDNLHSLHKKDNRVSYISFSKNFGHQNAIKAGLDYCEGDLVIMMDCDLQHPPTLLNELIRAYENGYKIVTTHRKDNNTSGYFKKKTSSLFYKIMNRFSDIELERGSADFRLISGKAVEVLKNINEFDLFYRGLVKWIGFKQISLEYDPNERKHGSTKYSIKKMVSLGLKGFTSFSTKPLYFAALIGICLSFISLLYIPYVIYALYNGHAVSGWASTIVTITFFGGLNLMILGIIGIYLGKLFIQSKNRPHYIVKEVKI